MNTEKREEIEKSIRLLQDLIDFQHLHRVRRDAMETILQFARQQLNLRVDGEKLLKKLVDHDIVPWASAASNHDVEALVLECLTTAP